MYDPPIRMVENEAILQMLLQTREVVVENTEVALQALARFAEFKAGFADCLIERFGHRGVWMYSYGHV